jgi:hypothetical protein
MSSSGTERSSLVPASLAEPEEIERTPSSSE